jgi:glyoxylase-like metal-dependent hydrolase (beta-lactamase superfamily II)
MKTLAPGISFLDLQFQGRPGVIAAGVLHGQGGIALVDPGPSSSLPTLRHELQASGISLADVDVILLTHIHLDHAGATGTIVAEHPRVRVHVHEKGAPHMASPQRLIESATRLYGDAMERLWGAIEPVPPAAIVSLVGGESIAAGGRRLRVASTPGHASHHVSYLSDESGIAFVGDVAGVRLAAGSYALPPTPPPDIDLEAWRDSLRRIRAWNADTLFVTHFGPHGSVPAHLSGLEEQMGIAADLARASLAREEDDRDREAWFIERMRAELRRHVGEADLESYELAGRFDLNWRGLARYWRKRTGAQPR